jgi:hypothetical protein
VLVGWTQPYQDRMVDIFNSVATILSKTEMYHYDVETLSYYFTRPYVSDIIETDWKVYGWLGTSGQFVRY